MTNGTDISRNNIWIHPSGGGGGGGGMFYGSALSKRMTECQ